MHHYHHRAFYLGVLSIVLIAAGLLALNFPVFIDAYDEFGFQIKCGTGFISNLTQAAAAGGGDNYVESMRNGADGAPAMDDPAGRNRLDPGRRPDLRCRHRVGSRIALRRGPGRLI